MTIAGNDFGDQPGETDERKGDEEPTYRLHHILLNPEVEGDPAVHCAEIQKRAMWVFPHNLEEMVFGSALPAE